ncbi:MAG: hypothetical protein QXP31_02270 [Pyrobaculum sp.]
MSLPIYFPGPVVPSFFFDPVVVASYPIMWYLGANVLLPFLLRRLKIRPSLVDWLIALGSAAMFVLVLLTILRVTSVWFLMIPVYWNFATATAVMLRHMKSHPVAILYLMVANMWAFLFTASKVGEVGLRLG